MSHTPVLGLSWAHEATAAKNKAGPETGGSTPVALSEE